MDTSAFFPAAPQWSNYVQAALHSPLPRYVWNSVFISVLTVAYQLVSGMLFAYAMAIMTFRGRGMLFALVLVSYMIPSAATYIPAYVVLSRMRLLDTFAGLVVSNLVSIFGIFLLRQAFMQVPRPMIESAKLDRASHLQILLYVVCPLAKPSLISFALISSIACYNNYMWPSLITNAPERYLVSQGLRHFFIEGGAYGTDWAMVMAGSALTVMPLLLVFAFAQNGLLSGISSTAGIKG
ncbi:MAG: carbohydrate ABC transporter permease [Oscillospiraceae bacterium]|nr:carbohydrate ABC transporter permease [Oscillospiraceae bacterium]